MSKKPLHFNLLKISSEFLNIYLHRFLSFQPLTVSQYLITWLLIAVRQ